MERAATAFAREANGGLIVTSSTLAQLHRELIITLAARHRLPAVYPYRFYITRGGLISYGPDTIGPYRRAAGYVDRILRGEKPADLPVQAPTRYELAINLKAAKALGPYRCAKGFASCAWNCRASWPNVLTVLSPRMMRIIEDLTGDWHRLDERIEGVTSGIEALAAQDSGLRATDDGARYRTDRRPRCKRNLTVWAAGPDVIR
jgi:hypothetical protein